MGLMDRLKGAQAKQETIVAQKSVEATEKKRTELSQERDRVAEEAKKLEADAKEAMDTLPQVEELLKDESLEPEVKAEYEAIKKDASELAEKYNTFLQTLESLNSQIASFETQESPATETAVEKPAVEVRVEKPTEVSKLEEVEEEPKVETSIVQTKEFNQVADALPFVGGAKQISESIAGKNLAGEELSGSERVIHGVKGAVELGLDLTGVGEVEKGAKLAYAGEKIASGIAENPEAVANLGKKITTNEPQAEKPIEVAKVESLKEKPTQAELLQNFEQAKQNRNRLMEESKNLYFKINEAKLLQSGQPQKDAAERLEIVKRQTPNAYASAWGEEIIIDPRMEDVIRIKSKATDGSNFNFLVNHDLKGFQNTILKEEAGFKDNFNHNKFGSSEFVFKTDKSETTVGKLVSDMRSFLEKKASLVPPTNEMIKELEGKREEVDAELNKSIKEVENLQREVLKPYAEKNESLRKSREMESAKMDYLVMKGDVEGFKESVTRDIENSIKDAENYRDNLPVMAVTASNSSFNVEGAIKDQNQRIERYKERMDGIKADPKGFPEYRDRAENHTRGGGGSDSIQSVNGIGVNGLINRYRSEIETAVKNEQSGRYKYPEKFDKLEGLVDIAIEKKDAETLKAIASLDSPQSQTKLPQSIKDKLEKYNSGRE